MQEFDVVVIGAGSGLTISSAAANRGMKVAVVEEGPMGGTCLNRGCIPSKILIHSADVAETVKHAGDFGIDAQITGIRFADITKRMASIVDEDAQSIEDAIRADENTTLFKARGKLVGERTVEVAGEQIQGEKVVIAAGTRPFVPPIEGLGEVPYYTSDDVMRLTEQPKRMIILGGGYISAELAHFFATLGTEVTVVEMAPKMVARLDHDLADTFTELFSKREGIRVVLGSKAVRAAKSGGEVSVTVQDTEGNEQELNADALLVATGRRSNTDLLEVAKAGVETTEKGYVKVDEYLKTTAENVWALGDIAGNYFFKHSANLEAQYVWRNAFVNANEPVDYTAMPYAVFSSPQMAGVGVTEDELKETGTSYTVGKYLYKNTGMGGAAMQEEHGFVKVLADEQKEKILGCHILGPDASTLIHEVIVAMKAGVSVKGVTKTVHIHPALSEVVQRAFASVR